MRLAARGADYVLLAAIRSSMKNAIGTLGRCFSELDIKRRRLTMLSCMPRDGKTQRLSLSLANETRCR
jgi:hypothetical protein